MPNLRRLGLPTTLLVTAGLTLYWVMAVTVSPRMGVTADEVVHLTGGYTYWKFNDYRLHPENGTLPMRLGALPLLGLDLKFPSLESAEWRTSKVNLVGEQFFYLLGNPFDDLLWRARMMIALAGALTVWLTWRWARGLFGPKAGWVALTLAVFCPAMLAHGGLATSDIALTGCLLAALSCVWRLLHRATWARLGLASLTCGLAFLAKMSGVLVVPLIAGLLVVRWLRRTPLVLELGRTRWLRKRSTIIGATFALGLATAAGSLVVLWGGYGFRFDGFNRAVSQADSYYFTWDVILDEEPLPLPGKSSLDSFVATRPPQKQSRMTQLIGWLRDHQLLPEAYLWGFAHTYKFARYRPAFFLGEHRTTGWRTFFPAAFVLKTPLPALLLIASGIGALAWCGFGKTSASRPFKPWLYRATPLVLFFVLYWLMAIKMTLNIGHRHILPTYPVFYVFAGASVAWLARSRPARLALYAALGLHAADSLMARPFYLSYFQPIAGGIERGYRYMTDSSYDWGQGLPDLARWLEAKKHRGDHSPVYLSYFGADSPQARGLRVVRFGDEINDYGPRGFPAQIRGGWFVISATHFQRVYAPTRGPWTSEHERLYGELRTQLLSLQAGPASAADSGRLLQAAKDYELLQFARLSHFLHQREPLEIIGGSLLVFRLADDEANRALYGPSPISPP